MLTKNNRLKRISEGILRAVETTPVETLMIRGASGLAHPVIAVGTDDIRRRLIVISDDGDGRTAALAQSDIQMAVGSMQVLFARPVLTFNSMADGTKGLFEDRPSFFHQVIQGLEGPHFDDLLHEAIQEHLHTKEMYQRINEMTPDSGISVDEAQKLVEPSLEQLRAYFDNKKNLSSLADQVLRKACTVPDVQMGLCPLFFGDFSPEELDTCENSTHPSSIRAVLRRHHILQFFFPPSDQLALGLIDRMSMPASKVVDQILTAPAIGHPIAEPEIFQDFASRSPSDIIEKLQECGLAVEGEFGLELSPEGRTIRQVIRFKPREGLLSKLLNRFSFKLDFKDLFKH